MRRALIFASAERYVSLPINLVVMAIVARLFTPAEFGLTVLAGAVWKFAEPIRDFGLSTYLIQQHELSTETTRTGFTLSLLITLAVTSVIILCSPWVEQFYEMPGLAPFLQITGLAFLMGPFVTPVYAMLRREMAFGTLAFINLTSLTINAVVTIALGALGFGYMSFAWAILASSAVGMLLGFYFRPALDLFRPCFTGSRDIATYAIYDSGRTMLFTIMETLPFLIFARLLNAEAVGLYRRALTVVNLPERVILSGLAPVVLPAFAKRAREGHGLKEAYLDGVTYLTAVIWPALLLLIVLAHPVVLVLLGHQWLATVPLVQILAGALLIWFPVGLTNPTLLAAGGVRDTFVLALITMPPTIAIQSLAAMYGLEALAWSTFVTVPIFISAAVYFVKRQLHFGWSELFTSMAKSAVVSLLTILGPILMVAWSGFRFDISIKAATVALLLAAIGWLGGLWITDHRLLGEIRWANGQLTKRSKAALEPISKLWVNR